MFQEDKLAQLLNTLPPLHRIVFASICCERLLPDYEAFSLIEDWGQPKLLRRTLDQIWDFIKNNSFPASDKVRIRTSIEICEKQAPDSGEFSSIFVWAAQNAVASIVDTLECCLDGDAARAARVGRLPTESLKGYLQIVNDPYLDSSERVRAIEASFSGDWNSLSEKEKVQFRLNEDKILKEAFIAWVWKAPLMVAELERQQRDLQILASHLTLNIALIDELIIVSREAGIRPLKRGLI